MKKEDAIFAEVREVLEGGLEELKEIRNPVIDKTTGQTSIKIPKSLALKSELKKSSEMILVFNPKKEKTINEISKSKFIIYLRGDDNGKDEIN